MNSKQFINNFMEKYIPRYFNSSDVESYLKTSEKKVIIFLRVNENAKAYEAFDSDFSLYLEKLPNSIMKKAVSSLFNRGHLYYGTANNNEGTIFTRVLISKNDKLVGVVLNAYALDIQVTKGITPQIDECIYAAYAGLVRASVLLHKQEIKKNYELHKLLVSYIFLMYLKILGRHITISPEIKCKLQVACAYIFYRQFFEEKHAAAIKNIQKHFVGDTIDVEEYSKIKDSLEKLNPFITFKNIPRLINEFGISSINQQQLTMTTLKILDRVGFYSLIGSLDFFLSTILLTKHPTELVSRGLMVNNEILSKIEISIEKLINKITYTDDLNFLMQKIDKNNNTETK